MTRRSLLIYGSLMAYLVSVKLLLTFLPGIFRSPAQAAVFQWKFLALWSIVGFVGIALCYRTGMAAWWQKEQSQKRRIALSAVVGITLGFISIFVDRQTHWTEYVAKQMHLSSIHIEFPASLLIYPGGAIIVEIIYRLFLIPFFLWLISSLILKGKSRSIVFWTLAIATSFIEPAGDISLQRYGTGLMLVVFAQDYALNFVQAVFFKKYGYGTSILTRVFFYLVWHVLYGFFLANS